MDGTGCRTATDAAEAGTGAPDAPTAVIRHVRQAKSRVVCGSKNAGIAGVCMYGCDPAQARPVLEMIYTQKPSGSLMKARLFMRPSFRRFWNGTPNSSNRAQAASSSGTDTQMW